MAPRKSRTQERAEKVVQRLAETGDWLTFLLELNEDLWDLRQSGIGRKQAYLKHVYDLLHSLQSVGSSGEPGE